MPLADRFWQSVKKTEGCWLWGGAFFGNGYGQIGAGGRDGKPLYAHRVSWEIHYGPITDGKEVCHNCPDGDNPQCVRPDHLFLGTHRENMLDSVAKGRSHTYKERGKYAAAPA